MSGSSPEGEQSYNTLVNKLCFRCFEAKIEESEEVGSHWESNSGRPELPVLCHWATTSGHY